jgi:hypothetical protein
MKSDYDSFYLKDLSRMIDRCALESQKEPNMMMMGHSDDVQLYLLHNASTAAYNRGIMKMREKLIEALTKEDDQDDGGS